MNTRPSAAYRLLFVILTAGFALLQPLLAVPPSAIDQKVVTNATVNVRATANGTILATQPSGRQGTVIGGPTTAGGYTWWNINFTSGQNGWVASIGIDVLPPNLIPSNFSINPSSGPPGTVVTVSFRITNNGGSNASGFNTNVRLSSSSSSPSTSDPLLQTFTTSSLGVSSSANANADVTIPSGTSAGTRYVWVIVDVNNTSGQTTAQYGDDRIYLPFTITTPPAAPGYMEAQAFSNRIELAWTDNSDNETGFKIERRTGSGSYSQIGTTGSNSTLYTDNTTNPRTTYTYRVRAYNAAGNSDYNNEVTATTPGGKPGAFTLSNNAPVWDPAIPGPKVQLNWSPASDAGGYAVYRNGSLYVAGIAGTGYQNSANLSAGATYTYFIRASNADGTTDSNTITVTMPFTPLTIPNAPGYMEGQAFADRIELGWTDNSTNESGFKIERRTGNGSYNQIATTSENSGSSAFFTDNTTLPQTTYTYRVRAYNAAGDSGYNTPVTITTLGSTLGSFTLSNQAPYWDSNAPAGPAVRLNWTSSEGANTYDVYRNNILYAANVGALSYLNNLNLTGGQTYSYHVIAKNGPATRQSNTIQVTMPIAPPVVPATLVSVRVNGSAQVAPGSTTPYQCFALFSNGQENDVTDTAQWSIAGTVPSSTFVAGGVLQVGATATGGTVNVIASYQTAQDQQKRTGQKSVTISTVFAVSASSTPPQLQTGTTYRINLSATLIGGTPPYTFTWDTNGDGIYGDLTGQHPQWTLISTGGTYTAKVLATDSQSRTAFATRQISIDKAVVPNQPVKLAPAVSVGAGRMRNSAGSQMTYDTAKRDVGLIVLTHGLYSTEESDKVWLKNMALGIERELLEQGKAVPNVAFYDWGEMTNPADSAYAASVEEKSKRWAAMLSQLRVQNWAAALALIAAGTAAQDIFWDLKYIRPIGQSHGQTLASYLWLESRAVPPRIDASKPIHLIGHSAGGFVMGECALRLKQLGFTVDLVTMLDTPEPFPEHLNQKTNPLQGFPNPGTVERYISSVYGFMTPPSAWLTSPDDYYYRRSFIDGWLSGTKAAHSRAHVWYLDNTINDRVQDGFYNSPFLHGRRVDHGLQAAPPRSPSPAPPPQAPPVSNFLTAFSSFGQVSESGGVHTITEQADAGIFKQVTVPPGVERLRFKYKFSGTGDGDFLAVRFGARIEIYYGLDLTISRENFLEAEVELGQYAELTDNLIFTLVSRGNPGAVLEIKEIEIIESDDPDGDGLTVAQELAAGTSSQNADSDGDGWSDSYEVNISHTDPTRDDTDGDGVTDPAEVLAGTDPNDSLSIFAVTEIIRNPNGSTTLRWSAETGKSYRIIMSANPAFENFETIASKLTGASPITSYTIPANLLSGNPAAFFRIGIE